MIMFACFLFILTNAHLIWNLFVCLKDYYKILEVDYDATEELIRLNYRKLALVCELKYPFRISVNMWLFHLDLILVSQDC